MLSAKKAEHFKQLLKARIAELERVLAAAQRETRGGTTRHADPADQAASEYERQSLVHNARVTQGGSGGDLLLAGVTTYEGVRPGMHVWLGMDWDVAHSRCQRCRIGHDRMRGKW